MPEPADLASSDWLTFDRYWAIYESQVRKFSTYFILDDRLGFYMEPDDVIRMRGNIECRGNLVVHIDERLAILSDSHIRVTDFSYDAEWLGPPRRKIFRYDNAHSFEQYNHPDEFHKHVWNPNTWRELPPQWIGRHAWPDIGDVLEELYEWWCTYKDALHLPE